mmetsp:Transcript_16889/g.40164  ORF Transcript_16889/g.40164 Transcript_16889/m.40164 type:complete len:220 (+) Transcript_16889:25-684(+)
MENPDFVDAQFHGYEPLRIVDDVINSFNDYSCDAADAMQKVLTQAPGMGEHSKAVEEGLDRWQLKVQRAADKNFDKFELYALNNVFRVPAEVTEAPVDGADQSGIDAELEELWAQLRQELATKSELQQRVAAASRETQRWEAHQHAVEGLCTTRRSEALGRVLHEARQLDEELRRGREQLHGSTAEGPTCVQKALSDRRIQISTAGVSDLKVLSSMLCT